MTRDELIRIAGEVGAYRYANRYLKYEPTHTITVEKLEAFAALVAAEYKRDAERYRMLRSNERFSVDEKCADGHWEPIHYDDLDTAIDAAMEKVK